MRGRDITYGHLSQKEKERLAIDRFLSSLEDMEPYRDRWSIKKTIKETKTSYELSITKNYGEIDDV